MQDEESYIEKLKEDKVEFLQLQFTDIIGSVKSLTIPHNRFEDVIYNGVMFDGSSIVGYKQIENSDMKAVPELSSYTILTNENYAGKTVRFICKIFNPDGTRFEGDPRYILEKQVERLSKENKRINIGPELEYFIFNQDEEGEPTIEPSDYGGYFDKEPLDRSFTVKQEIIRKLEGLNYFPEASHHEVAYGQHEIDVKYSDAITMADRIIMIKSVVKETANEYGYYATFMPKPIKGVNGNGMHVHQSIFSGDENLFYKESTKHGLSDYAMHYLGGLLKNVKSSSLVLASTVNSYKRLIPGYEAPVYIAWANRNRSALVRIPSAAPKGKRLELRYPDSAGNQYLQFAAIIGMGLDGIENKIDPPDSIEKNIFEMNEEERKKYGIESMPASLGQAITAFKESSLMKEIFGDYIYNNLIRIKENEWADFRQYVTDWEINRYLDIY
ncbi:type I glutamate--ammonia ligase [Ferroplasma sp.]|uniref:type I glutamate--ammonia ligase n=1 Tax=Ferroplasma sp. TaxID=2591003 RepID=UPI0026137FB9|nr:type I glutamate--ammonia ligase [Ferroplasma sp.]